MFYCDDCAKKLNYPVMGTFEMRSFGECEECGKEKECSDFPSDMREGLGYVTIYVSKDDPFGEKKPTYKAQKGKCAVFGFDLNKCFGGKGALFTVVFFSKNFANIETARKHLAQLRATAKKGKSYHIYNDKGKIQKAKKGDNE